MGCIDMSGHIYLAHHGIKGMKWGVRRFQNEDGSLTSAGKKRYDLPERPGSISSIRAKYRAQTEERLDRQSPTRRIIKQYRESIKDIKDFNPLKPTVRSINQNKESGRKINVSERLNKAASTAQAHRREIAVAAGVTAAGIALAAYGNHRHVVNAARQEAYARYREQKGEEIARGLLADAMNNPNIVSFENAAGSFHR